MRILPASLLTLAVFLAACGPSRQNRIVVGSKNFTEQLILGELIAQQIENQTHLPVERHHPPRQSRPQYRLGSSSGLSPAASTEAALTGFSGIFASLTLVRTIFIPPTIISWGGGEKHSWSLQETASPNRVAKRRER